MNDVIVIEGTKLQRVEYNGQAVVSLPMVDRVHKRPEGTARRTFFKFRNNFISGEDYFEIPYEEWSALGVRNTSAQRGSTYDQKEEKGGHRGWMIFLTLTGYLMLVKTFTDDLSWSVQRRLVKSYFRAALSIAELTAELLDAYRVIKLLSRRKGNKVQEEDMAAMVALKRKGLGTKQISERTRWSPTAVKANLAKAKQLGLFDDNLLPA